MSNSQIGAGWMPHQRAPLLVRAGQICPFISIATTPLISGDAFEMGPLFFFFNDPAPPEISPLSPPDAFPILARQQAPFAQAAGAGGLPVRAGVSAAGMRCTAASE